MPDGPLRVVYGELDGFPFTLSQAPGGTTLARLELPGGQHPEGLLRALHRWPALQAALGEVPRHGLPPVSLFAADDHLSATWMPQGLESCPEGHLPLLAAILRAAVAGLPLLGVVADRRCTICARPDTPVSREDEATARICQDCRDSGQREARRLAPVARALRWAEPPQAEGPGPSLELPPGLTMAGMQRRAEQLELELERDPGGYRRRLLGLALLGQAALLAGAVALGTPAPARSPGQSLQQLPGHRLERSQAAGFYQWLDGISAAMQGPLVDLVLLTPGTRCQVSEIRTGFGRYQRVLSLGLLLLESLEQEEMRAVLAHEMGHLHGNDPRWAWIYNAATGWLGLAGRIGDESSASVLRTFARWYVPRFFVRAQVARRRLEVQADRRAALLAGDELCARALIKSSLLEALYSEAFARGIWRCARQGEVTPQDHGALIRQGMEELGKPGQERALRKLLARLPLWTDTHPGLSARLRALGPDGRADPPGTLAAKSPATGLLDGYAKLRLELNAALEEAASIRAEALQRTLLGARRRCQEPPAPCGPGWIRRARDLRMLGRLEQALEALDEASSWPDGAAAFGERLQLLVEMDRLQEAAQEWRQLLAARPQDARAHAEASEFFSQAGLLDDESRCLERLLALQPAAETRQWIEDRLRGLREAYRLS
jgi:tetratricopeptide (TPR) repeat protein